MPLYDYKCERGHEFEALHPSDENLRTCAVEGCEAPVDRLMGAPVGRVVGGTPLHHKRAPRK